MSDTILAGNLTIYYLDESRRKQIRWTGTASKTDVEKMIDVYDATEDLFTLPTQSNDGLIFSGETPGEYTIGKIDAGEIEPWFVDMKTMEHVIGDYANFTGCALKTSGWKRDLPGDGTGNTGIVVVPVTAASNNIVVGDIGNICSHADGDAGTLLDVIITGGALDYLWIRPDSNALADDWNSSSLDVTCNAHTAPQTAAAVTGEMVWGNYYTQGALVNDTYVFVFQDGSRVTSSDEDDQDWWPDGHADRSIPITDFTTADFPIIDDGYLMVKANQYGSKYTYAIIRMNSTSGGNVSAGLSSGDDITNTTGYASITMTAVSVDDFSVGDEIEGSDAVPARAIITQIDGSSPTYTFHYYLIGDPMVDFTAAAETITNNDGTGSATKNTSAPADQGPALTSWFDGAAVPTFSFANTQADIDDDGNDEEWGIEIVMGDCSLSQMHEYNKYAHMRGSILDQDGLEGQEWIGLDYAINYASITGTVAEGSVVTGKTSGATGTVVSNPAGVSNTALLRDSRGTFLDGEAIYLTDGSHEFDAAGLTVDVIVPVAANSFGTLAGVNFFATRGVLLSGYKSAEENLFSLIDATGITRARPTSITMEILNLKQYDYAWCFRLTGSGGSVDKTEYSATGGEAAGAATLTVDTAIAADVPGKTAGGTLFLVDVNDDYKEYVIRFSSYVAATGVVTLANVDIAAVTSGSVSTVGEVGAFANTKVGDLVYNHDLSEVTYVSEVNSDDLITVNPEFSVDPTGDHVELNCVPITLVDTADQVFFTIVTEFKETDGTAAAAMQYIADIFSRVVVRNTSSAATKIKGFTQAVTIGTGGGTSSATRIENTVYGS